MKRKKILALALALTTAFTTLAPNTGFLPAAYVRAAATDYISVKLDGASYTSGDVVMGRNDTLVVDTTLAGSVSKVSFSLAASGGYDKTGVTCVQQGTSATITTSAAKLTNDADDKVTLSIVGDGDTSNKEIDIDIYIGKNKISYYNMTAAEYRAAEASGETPTAYQEIYMRHYDYNDETNDWNGNVFNPGTEKNLNLEGIYKPGYKKAVSWTDINGDNPTVKDGTAYNKLLSDTDAKNGVKVFAEWTPITYKVVLDPNVEALKTAFPSIDDATDASKTAMSVADSDANTSESGANAIYDKEFVLPMNEFAFEDESEDEVDVVGYYLDSWNTKADGTGTPYKDRSTVKNLIDGDTLFKNQGEALSSRTTTLYAQWKKGDVTVKYMTPNSAMKTSGVSNRSGKADSNYDEYKLVGMNSNDVSNYKLDKTAYEPIVGYEFKGWSKNPGDVDGNIISNLNNVTDDEGVYKLYPIYEKKTYTINFDKNSKDASGSFNAIAVQIGDDVDEILDTVKLEKAFTREGYTYDNTNPYALTTYGDKVVTIGSGGELDGALTDVQIKALFDNDKSSSATIYVQWVGIPYNIAWNKNVKDAASATEEDDSITDGSPISANYGETFTLPAAVWKYPKNVFVGWKAGSADGKLYKAGDEFTIDSVNSKLAVDGNPATITFYSAWEQGYEVRYHGFDEEGEDTVIYSSGILNETKAKTYTIGLPDGVEEPTKTGYTLVGWTGDADGNIKEASLTGKGYLNSPLDMTEIRDIYPVFKANTMTVKYDANAPEGSSAAGSMEDQKLTFDGGVKLLKPNDYTVDGYKFLGWNTAADGSGVFYDPATADMNEYLMDTSETELTLYAQWAVPYYYVIGSAGIDEASINVPFGTSAEEIKEILNSKTYIGLGDTTDEQSVKYYYKEGGYFSIAWDIAEKYDITKPDTYSFEGVITLTPGAVINNNVAAAVFVDVVVPEKETDLSKAVIASIDDQAYTGNPITPVVTVTLDGITLVKDTDYTVSYTDNIEVGNATVSITGIGEYTGTKTATFKIVKKDDEVTPEPTPVNPEPEVNPTPVTPEPETPVTTPGGADVTPSNGGGSGSGGGGGSSNAKTVKNADGSTTTTTTTAKGTIETTTKTNADGSKTTSKVVKNKDGSGSVTETSVSAAGTTKVVEVVTDTTGAATEVTTSVSNSKGASMKVTYAAKGTAITVSKVETTGKTAVSIPATVKVGGKTYKVTKIAASALKGNKEITKVTLGKNVKSIGKNAFNGDSKLKTIVMKKAPTTVGKNAFKGIAKKATIKIKATKKAFKTAKKLIKKSGVASTVKIKRTK